MLDKKDQVNSIDDIHSPLEDRYIDIDSSYVKNSVYPGIFRLYDKHEKSFDYNPDQFVKDFVNNPDEILSNIHSFAEKDKGRKFADELTEKIKEKTFKKTGIDDVIKERKQSLEKAREESGFLQKAWQAGAEQVETMPGIPDISFDEREKIKETKKEYDQALQAKQRIKRDKQRIFVAGNYDLENMTNNQIKKAVKDENLPEYIAKDLIQVKENEGFESLYKKAENDKYSKYNVDNHIEKIVKGDVEKNFYETDAIDETDKGQIISAIKGLKDEDIPYENKIQEIERIKETYITNQNISDKEKKKLEDAFNVLASSELSLDQDGYYNDTGWYIKSQAQQEQGKTIVDALNNLYSEGLKEYKNQNKQLEEQTKLVPGQGFTGTTPVRLPGVQSFYDKTEEGGKLLKKLAYNQEANRLYKTIEKVTKAKTGLEKGWTTTDWADILTAGIKSTVDAANQYGISNKIKNGEPLSNAEQRLINAVGDYAHFYDQIEKTAGFEIGAGLPETFKFIAQFALTSGAGRGAYTAGKKTMQKALQGNLKNKALRFAATKALPAATVGVPVQTALQVPMWLEPTLKAMRGQTVPKKRYSTDYTIEQGSRKNFGEALKEGYGDAYQETLTEWAGFALAKIPRFAKAFKKVIGRSLGKALEKSKLPKVKIHGPERIAKTFQKSWNVIHKRTGMGNILEEMGEEELGFVFDAMEGEYKPENFKEFLTDQLVVAGSIGPISLPGTVVSLTGSDNKRMTKISFKEGNKTKSGLVDTELLKDLDNAITESGFFDKERADKIIEKYGEKINKEKYDNETKKYKKNSIALIRKYLNLKSNQKTSEAQQKTKEEAKNMDNKELDNAIAETNKNLQDIGQSLSRTDEEGQKSTDLENEYMDLNARLNILTEIADERVTEETKTEPQNLMQKYDELNSNVEDLVQTPGVPTKDVNEVKKQRSEVIAEIKEKFPTLQKKDVDDSDPITDVGQENVGNNFVLRRKFGNKKGETLDMPATITGIREDGTVEIKIGNTKDVLRSKDKLFDFANEDISSTIQQATKDISSKEQRSMQDKEKFQYLKDQLENDTEAVNKQKWNLGTDKGADRTIIGLTDTPGYETRAFTVKNDKGHTYDVYPVNKEGKREKIANVETLKNKFENPESEGPISFKITKKEEWNPKGEAVDDKGEPYGDRIDMYIGDEYVGVVAERKRKSGKAEPSLKVKETETGVEPGTKEEESKDALSVKDVPTGKEVEKTGNENIDKGLDELDDAFTKGITSTGDKNKTFEEKIFSEIINISKGLVDQGINSTADLIESVKDYVQRKFPLIQANAILDYIRNNYKKVSKALQDVINKVNSGYEIAEAENSFDSSKRTEKILGKYANALNTAAATANVSREEVDKFVLDFTQTISFPKTSTGLITYMDKMQSAGKIGKALSDYFNEKEWTHSAMVSFHREWKDVNIKNYKATYYEDKEFIERQLNASERIYELNNKFEQNLESLKINDIEGAINQFDEYQKTEDAKKLYDRSLDLLERLTGISKGEWKEYFSPETGETVVYYKKKDEKGKVHFEKVAFNSYEDLLNASTKTLGKDPAKHGIASIESKPGKYIDEKSLTKRNNAYEHKKVPNIINALIGSYKNKISGNPKASRKQFIKEYFSTGSGNAWSNIEKLAHLSDIERPSIRFTDAMNNHMQSLLGTSMLDQKLKEFIDQKYDKKKYKENWWVQHHEQKGEFPTFDIYHNFKTDTNNNMNVVDSEKIFVNDFIGNQVINFVKGQTEYDHWLGQFGDKSNIFTIKSPKYSLPETVEEKKKITDNIPGFKESVKRVKEAVSDRHYQAQKKITDKAIEDFVYSWHMNDKDMNQVMLGENYEQLFKSDFVKATKRKAQVISNGTRYMTDVEGGLGETYSAVVIKDPVWDGKKEDSLDGMELCTSEHMNKCAISSGEITNKLEFKNGIFSSSKELSIGQDEKTGEYYLYKTNKVNIAMLSQHNPDRYGPLHDWMIANNVDRVIPVSGAKATKQEEVLDIYDENGNIKSFEQLPKKEINKKIVDRLTNELIIQQDLRTSTVPKNKPVPKQIFVNVLSYNNNANIISTVNNIRLKGAEQFNKNFLSLSEKEKINILLSKGYFDANEDAKKYFQRQDATLNYPEYRSLARNAIMAHFQKSVLDVSIQRVQLQELPSDGRLRTLTKTRDVDGIKTQLTDANDNPKCQLPEVDANIPGMRYAEYYDTQQEAVETILGNPRLQKLGEKSEPYHDLIDEEGNVKEWEITYENGKYKVPGEPVIVPRVPAHGVSSHLASRLNKRIEQGNFIILDKETQEASGSDYDGDTRFPIIKTKNPRTGKEKLGNDFINEIVKACEDVENFEINKTPIRIDRFDSKIEEGKPLFNDFGSAIEMRERNAQGQNLRGITTNLNAAFSFLSNVNAKTYFRGKDGKTRNVIRDEKGAIKALVGDLQNMAFDNNQKTRLPFLGINEQTANMFYFLMATHEKFDTVKDVEGEINRYMDVLNNYFDISLNDNGKPKNPLMYDFVRRLKRKNSPVTRTDNKTIFKELYAKYKKAEVDELKALYYSSQKMFNIGTLINGTQDATTALEDINKLRDTYDQMINDPKKFGFKIDKNKADKLTDPLETIIPMLEDTYQKGYVTESDLKPVGNLITTEAEEKNYNRTAILTALNEQRPEQLTWDETVQDLVIDKIEAHKGKIKGNAFFDSIVVKTDKNGNKVLSILDVYKFGRIPVEKLAKIKEDFDKFQDSTKLELTYYAIQQYGHQTNTKNGNYYALLSDEWKAWIGNVVNSYINREHTETERQQIVNAYRDAFYDNRTETVGEQKRRPIDPNKDISQRKAKEVEEQEATVAETKPEKLIDIKDKEAKPGSVVNYKGKTYLLWNINDSGKAQLIDGTGKKFTGTPNIDKLEVLGNYPTVSYNNTEYIVSDKGKIYSTASGKIVYQGKDNSSKEQYNRIRGKAFKQREEQRKGSINNQILNEASTQEYYSGKQELQNFIEQHLQKTYPDIKVFRNRQSFFDFVEQNGGEYSEINFNSIGMAFGNAIFVDPESAVQDTFFHENAHIYFNALPAGEHIKIKMRRLFKEEGMSKQEVDEEVVKAIGQAGTNIADIKLSGTKLKQFMDLLKEFWSRVKIFFGKYSKYDLANVMAHDIWRNKKQFTGQDFKTKRIENMINNPEERFTVEDGEEGHLYILDKGTKHEKIFTGLTTGIEKISKTHFNADIQAEKAINKIIRQEVKVLDKLKKEQELNSNERKLFDKVQEKNPWLTKDNIKKQEGKYIYNETIEGYIDEGQDVNIFKNKKEHARKEKERIKRRWQAQQEHGTTLHAIVEMIVNGKSKKEIRDSHSESFSDETICNETIDYFTNIVNNIKEQGWTIESEKIAYDENNRVATKMDMYLTKGDKAVVVDLKTFLSEDEAIFEGEGEKQITDVNENYESAYGTFRNPVSEVKNSKKNRHKYQVEIGANMAEENYGKSVDRTRIIPIVYGMDSNMKISLSPAKKVKGFKYAKNIDTRNKAKKMAEFFNKEAESIEKHIVTSAEMKELHEKTHIPITEWKVQNKSIKALATKVSDIENIDIDEVSNIMQSEDAPVRIRERLKEKGHSDSAIDKMSLKDIVNELSGIDYSDIDNINDFESRLNDDDNSIIRSDYSEEKNKAFANFMEYQEKANAIWDKLGTLDDFSELKMTDLGNLLRRVANLDNYHKAPLSRMIAERYMMIYLTNAVNEEFKMPKGKFKMVTTFLGEAAKNPDGVNGAMSEFKRAWGVLGRKGKMRANTKLANLFRVSHDIGSDNRMLQLFGLEEVMTRKVEHASVIKMRDSLDNIVEKYSLTNEDLDKAIVTSKAGFKYFSLAKAGKLKNKGINKYLEKVYELKKLYDHDFAERENNNSSVYGDTYQSRIPVMSSFIEKNEFVNKFSFLDINHTLSKNIYKKLRPQRNDNVEIQYGKDENTTLYDEKVKLVQKMNRYQSEYDATFNNQKPAKAKELEKRIKKDIESYEKFFGNHIKESKAVADQRLAGVKMPVAGGSRYISIGSENHHYLFVNHLASLVHNRASQRLGIMGEFIAGRSTDKTKGAADFSLKKIEQKVYGTLGKEGGKAADIIISFSAKKYMGLNIASQILTNLPAGIVSDILHDPMAVGRSLTYAQQMLSNKNGFSLTMAAITRFRKANGIGEVINDAYVGRLKEMTIKQAEMKMPIHKQKDISSKVADTITEYMFGDKGNKLLFYPVQMVEALVQTPLVIGNMTKEQFTELIEREKMLRNGEIKSINYTTSTIMKYGKVLPALFSKEDIVRISSIPVDAHGLYGPDKPLWGTSIVGKVLGMFWGSYSHSYVKRMWQAPGTNVLNQEISGYSQSFATVMRTMYYNLRGDDYKKKTRMKHLDKFLNVEKTDKTYVHETKESAINKVMEMDETLTKEEAKRYVYQKEKELPGGETVTEYRIANFLSFDEMYSGLDTKMFIDNIREIFTDEYGMPMINENGELVSDVKNNIGVEEDVITETLKISPKTKNGLRGFILNAFFVGVGLAIRSLTKSAQDDIEEKYGPNTPVYVMSSKDQLKWYINGILGYRLGGVGLELLRTTGIISLFSNVSADQNIVANLAEEVIKLIALTVNPKYESTAGFDRPVGSSKFVHWFLKQVPGISANSDEIRSLYNILYTPDDEFGLNRYTVMHIENRIANYLNNELSEMNATMKTLGSADPELPEDYFNRTSSEQLALILGGEDELNETIQQLNLYYKSRIIEDQVTGMVTEDDNIESKRKAIEQYIDKNIENEKVKKRLMSFVKNEMNSPEFKERVNRFLEYEKLIEEEEVNLEEQKPGLLKTIKEATN